MKSTLCHAVDFIRPHLPEFVLRHCNSDKDLQTQTHCHAVALFTDVVGFTSLTSHLFALPDGAEQVTSHLNSYFSKILQIVKKSGGDVAFFSGDAVMCLWLTQKEEDIPTLTKRGVAAGWKIAGVVEQSNVINAEIGVHVGLGIGPTTISYLGDTDSETWRYLVSGSAVEQAAQTCCYVVQGQLGFSSAALEHVKELCEATEVEGKDTWILEKLDFTDDNNYSQVLPCSNQCIGKAQRFLQTFNLQAQLRIVSTVFVKILSRSSMEKSDHKNANCAIIEILRKVQLAGGVCNKVLSDDKGLLALCAFGLPGFCNEDDAIRSVRFSLELATNLEAIVGPVAIGITRANLYCGEVGGSWRKEYTILGEGVNMAARLMSLNSDSNKLGFQVHCDQATYEEVCHTPYFKTSDPIEIELKGFEGPQQIYQLLKLNPMRQRLSSSQSSVSSHSSTHSRHLMKVMRAHGNGVTVVGSSTPISPSIGRNSFTFDTMVHNAVSPTTNKQPAIIQRHSTPPDQEQGSRSPNAEMRMMHDVLESASSSCLKDIHVSSAMHSPTKEYSRSKSIQDASGMLSPVSFARCTTLSPRSMSPHDLQKGQSKEGKSPLRTRPDIPRSPRRDMAQSPRMEGMPVRRKLSAGNLMGKRPYDLDSLNGDSGHNGNRRSTPPSPVTGPAASGPGYAESNRAASPARSTVLANSIGVGGEEMLLELLNRQPQPPSPTSSETQGAFIADAIQSPSYQYSGARHRPSLVRNFSEERSLCSPLHLAQAGGKGKLSFDSYRKNPGRINPINGDLSTREAGSTSDHARTESLIVESPRNAGEGNRDVPGVVMSSPVRRFNNPQRSISMRWQLSFDMEVTTKVTVRAAELSTMRSMVVTLKTGIEVDGTNALLLRGPMGIGKSYLLKTASEYANVEGVEWLLLQGSQLEQDVPFAALRGLLDELLNRNEISPSSRGHAEVQENLKKYLKSLPKGSSPSLTHLAYIDPKLATNLRDLGLQYKPDPLSNKNDVESVAQHVHTLLIEMMKVEYEHHPLLLLFDDIQFLDKYSLAFIHRLLQLNNCAVIMAQRTGIGSRVAPNPTAHRGSQDFGSRARSWDIDQLDAVVVDLAPLTRKELALFISSTLNVQGTDYCLSSFIQRETDGVPGLAAGALDALTEANAIVVVCGIALLSPIVNISNIPMAGDMQNNVMAHVDRLPQLHVQLLKVASVIGRQFSVAMVAECLGVAQNGITEVCIQLLKQGFLIALQDGYPSSQMNYLKTHFEFSAEYLPSILYRTMLHRERREYHEKIAFLLKEEMSLGHDVILADIARHFRLTNHVEYALYYTEAQTIRECKDYMYWEAFQTLEELQGMVATMDRCGHPKMKVELQFNLASCYYNLGNTQKFIPLAHELIRDMKPNLRTTWSNSVDKYLGRLKFVIPSCYCMRGKICDEEIEYELMCCELLAMLCDCYHQLGAKKEFLSEAFLLSKILASLSTDTEFSCRDVVGKYCSWETIAALYQTNRQRTKKRQKRLERRASLRSPWRYDPVAFLNSQFLSSYHNLLTRDIDALDLLLAIDIGLVLRTRTRAAVGVLNVMILHKALSGNLTGALQLTRDAVSDMWANHYQGKLLLFALQKMIEHYWMGHAYLAKLPEHPFNEGAEYDTAEGILTECMKWSGSVMNDTLQGYESTLGSVQKASELAQRLTLVDMEPAMPCLIRSLAACMLMDGLVKTTKNMDAKARIMDTIQKYLAVSGNILPAVSPMSQLWQGRYCMYNGKPSKAYGHLKKCIAEAEVHQMPYYKACGLKALGEAGDVYEGKQGQELIDYANVIFKGIGTCCKQANMRRNFSMDS